jgi:beta-mannosidase
MNKKISINTEWKLRHEDLMIEELNPEVFKHPDSNCMNVDLPCDVHMPLIKEKIIPEPTVGMGYLESEWIENRSWWFYKELLVEENELQNNDNIYLVLEQLDSNAKIWINSELIGEQKSVHYPFKREIKTDLKEGINTILVRVTTGYEGISDKDIQSLGGRILNNGGRGDKRRAFSRKPQYTCGWDWAPRLLTCGMNGNAYLMEEQSVVVRDVHVTTSRIEPSALLHVSLNLDNVRLIATQEVEVELSILYQDMVVHSLLAEYNLRAGSNYFEHHVNIDEPQLWWPNGYGEQPLYDLKVKVTTADASDVYESSFGIRKIELDNSRIDKDNRLFAIKVNNEKIFCKGANWVPSDVIYARVSEDKIVTLLQAAKDENFTMLRIWGGGIFEQDLFYDLCDKYGILIWQDFMYACSVYPETRKWFMEESEQEAIYQVKRLRNHPCLALWCGNNEMYWIYGEEEEHKLDEKEMKQMMHNIYNYLLPDIIYNYSKETIYWNSSPYGGPEASAETMGDNHIWPSWRYHNPVYESHEIYDDRETKFMSEYGYMGPCHKDSIMEYCGENVDNQSNELYKAHSHYYNSEFKRGMVYKGICQHYGETVVRCFEDYLLYGQAMHGHLLEYSLLSYRSRENCYGALYWMFNDAWGEEGWTTIDYYLRRKPSYYFVKRALMPIIFILKRVDKKVRVIALNETNKAVAISFDAGRQDYLGHDIVKEQRLITLEARSRSVVYEMDYISPSSQELYYVKNVKSNEHYINSAYLADHYFKQIATIMPDLGYQIEMIGKDIKVTIEAKHYAHVVFIDLPMYKELSDNYFDMLPGEIKEIFIYNCAPVKTEDVVVKSIIN